MALITDPEAIRFVDEQVRPLAEKLRDLNVILVEMRALWTSGLSAHFKEPKDAVGDGREAEGISRLTANDVTRFVSQANAILTRFEVPNSMATIRKPCVRKLSIGE